ncbi:MAG TPA: tetratricopeptide repeat protein [Verrucomicrobiae bacterium]|nr:tetratricopeptide repeat protein [Verrucomicrobiae bacterium]
MRALQAPDLLYLEAAKGWFILGDVAEARNELNQIDRKFARHPDVLEVEFALAAKKRLWTSCMDIAAALLERAPDRPTAWINCAITLHQLKQTQEAWDALYTVRNRFPKVSTIPYNLACYACQLGRIDDSRQWFKRALTVGGKKIRSLALEDPDLQPLWAEIKFMESGAGL